MFNFLGARKKKPLDSLVSSIPEKHPEEEEAESKLKMALDMVSSSTETIKATRTKARNVHARAITLRPQLAAGVKK